MKKNKLFIKFSVSVMYKIVSCIVAFFILASSMNLSDFDVQEISFMEVAETSIETVLTQFFYISIFPIKKISELFISNVDSVKETGVFITKEKENGKESSEDNNSSKASVGYAVLMVDTVVLGKNVKNKGMKSFVVPGKVEVLKAFVDFRNIFFIFLKNFVNVLFVVMLLLAILLARRDIGDDNIIIKIKNNKMARLTV